MLRIIQSFFYSNSNNKNQPPKQFTDHLFEVIDRRFSSEDEFEKNLSELDSLMIEAKNNNYDLNIYNKKGLTFIIHVILRFNRDNEDYCLKILNILYNNGFDINKISSDRRQTPPITPASRRCMVKTVEWLLNHDANPLIKDKADDGTDYCTALEYIEKIIPVQQQRQNDDMVRDFLIIQNLLLAQEQKHQAKNSLI